MYIAGIIVLIVSNDQIVGNFNLSKIPNGIGIDQLTPIMRPRSTAGWLETVRCLHQSSPRILRVVSQYVVSIRMHTDITGYILRVGVLWRAGGPVTSRQSRPGQTSGPRVPRAGTRNTRSVSTSQVFSLYPLTSLFTCSRADVVISHCVSPTSMSRYRQPPRNPVSHPNGYSYSNRQIFNSQ